MDINNLVCLMHETNHRMHEIKNIALEKIGITFSQMLVIRFLAGNKGNVNQKAIQNRMNIKGSSVTSLLNTMQKGGLITKEVNPLDAREFYVKLTEKGKDTSCKIKKILTDIDDKAMQALTAEEKDVMRSLLTKIIDRLSNGEIDND